MITMNEIENDKDILIGTITDDGSTSGQLPSQDESPKNDEVNAAANDAAEVENEPEEAKEIQSFIDKKGVNNFSRTQQDKLGHSFAKLKQKHKAEVEGLKNEIAELKKQLETKVVKSDYESEEEYLDAKLEEKLAKKELASKEKQLDNANNDSSMAFYKERAMVLYPTKVEQDAYSDAYRLGLNNGAINMVYSDPIMRDFIHESDYGPKLIEHFCHKPDVAERLSSMSTARKSVELVALESRLKNYLERLANTPKQVQPKDKLKVKAPVVGNVANKGNNKINDDRFNSDEDLWEFLKSC